MNPASFKYLTIKNAGFSELNTKEGARGESRTFRVFNF